MKFRYYALQLCLLCILVFIVQITIPGFKDMFILNNSSYTQVWRFLSAIFLHEGITHLLYNLFALALFGSFLEGAIGGRKFLSVFFISGILANIFAVNFYSSSLGASGAIFGIIGALIIIKPTMFVFAFGLPMPMIVAGVLWAAGDLIGVFVPDNVGHLAHLAGMGVGLVLGAIFRSKALSLPEKEFAVLNEDEVRRWEDYYVKKLDENRTF